MPVLSDSGSRIFPSGEHESVQLEEAKSFMISLLPTQELPIVSNPISPLPPINNAWVPPAKVMPCRSQQIRVNSLHRVSFGWQGQQLNIEAASREEWLLFLVQSRVNVVGYDEGTGHPGLYRCLYINQLLAEGKLELLKVGNESDDHAPLLLACPAIARTIVTLPTCSDLAVEGQWSTDLCCHECHRDPSLLTEYFLASDDDPLGGRRGRRRAFLCCHALQMIDGFYPGKIYSAMPFHDDLDCIGKEE